MTLTDQADGALLALLELLGGRGYAFTPPTPLTHQRVVRRADRQRAKGLRDVFGWSLPFAEADLEPGPLALLQRAGALEQHGGLLRSAVRVAALDGRLYLHSAFPTDETDAVFFGPDSYRFAAFIRSELDPGAQVRTVVDIGAGSGVGGLTAAQLAPEARIVLTDTNPLALRLAGINAAHAGVRVDTVQTTGLDGLDGPLDLVVANPPYIVDPAGRTYRDGGAMHGADISLDWAAAAAGRLAPGGRLLLYTGSAIVGGEDPFHAALLERLEAAGCSLRYRELDPDVFGEELEHAAYADVERIAVVGAVAVKQG